MHHWFMSIFAATTLCFGGDNWPQFKGSSSLGTADRNAPVNFGAGTNLLWRVEVAQGNSSPVIWREKLYLSGFAEGKLKTTCYSTLDGRTLWEKEVKVERIEPAHSLNGPAAPTPVTDGQRVYVYFGSFGLIACDMEGK